MAEEDFDIEAYLEEGVDVSLRLLTARMKALG